MAHHYTKNTTGITRYCNTCRRNTQHYVWDGRLGPCKEDHHKDKPAQPAPVVERQQSLFDEVKP